MPRFRSDLRTVAVAAIVAFLVAGAPALADRADRAATPQARCKPGAVLAFANVIDANAVTPEYTLHGVGPHFNCADGTNRVLVKKSSDGVFFVDFPGISDSPHNGGRMVAAVSLSGAAARTIGYFSVQDEGQGDVVEVDINQLNGAPQDNGFSIQLFGFRNI